MFTNQEMLDHSVALYKKARWGDDATVSYMSVNMSDKLDVIDKSRGAACHAALTLYNSFDRDHSPDYVVHTVATKAFVDALSKNDTEGYYDYLFNRSPIRDSYLTKDATKVWKEGIAVTCHGLPNPLSAMGCKAIRHAWEKPWVYRTMQVLVNEGGFSENEGFFLGFLFNAHSDPHNVVQQLTEGHVIIYPDSIDVCALYNFVNGIHPQYTSNQTQSRTMNQRGGFEGVPRYWNKGGISDTRRYLGWMERHPTFRSFQTGGTKGEIDPNPFKLLPLLFKEVETHDKFGPLRRLVADTYEHAEKTLGKERKAG